MRRLSQLVAPPPLVPYALSTRRLLVSIQDSLISALINRQDWSRLTPIVQSSDPSEFLQRLFGSCNFTACQIASYIGWSEHAFKVSYPVEVYAKIFVFLENERRYSKLRSLLHNMFLKQESPISISRFADALLTASNKSCGSSLILDMFFMECVYIGNNDIALEGFKQAADYGFKLSVVSCNYMLAALVKELRMGDVDFVYKEMIKRGIVPNLVTYNNVFCGLCRAWKFERVGNIDTNKVDELAEDMKVFGVVPDSVTCTALLTIYCNSGTICKAEEVFKEMVDRRISLRVVTYNTLINGYQKDGNLVAATRVFKEMKALGLKPNIITYNSLINGLCSGGEIDDAMHLMEDMKAHGIVPNVVTYTSLINGFCSKGEIDNAMHLMEDMKAHGIASDVVTYNSLINGFCSKGEIDDAMHLMKDMKAHGIVSDVVTYNSLINGFCCKGKIDDAMHLMKDMKGHGIVPDVVTYNSLINGLCSIGRIEDAMHFMEDMKGHGIVPNVVTYNTLTHGYCKGKVPVRMYKVNALLKEMMKSRISPNIVMYTTIIHALCKDDNLAAATTVFNIMKARGLKLSMFTFNSLIKGLCSKGKVVEAMRLRDEMLGLGSEPDIVTYNTFLDAFLKNNMFKEAEELLKNIVERGVANVLTFNTLINAYCKAGQIDEAVAVFDLMLHKKVSPIISTYNCLIGGYVRAGNLKAAHNLLNEMEETGLKADFVTQKILRKTVYKQGH